MIMLAVLLFSMAFVSAEGCNPKVSLINQDPYPAIPGEYVKLVFQINELANTNCRNFVFELLEKYPLIFDPGKDSTITLDSGFYERDYGSFLIAPYKVRVDKSALKGDNPIEVRYKYGNNLEYELGNFYLNIEDAHADFEVHIDDYSYATNELTIEILNIAEVDVEALTLEIPKQEGIQISGTNRVVVGDLDSNEYTTADFRAMITGENLEIKIIYTDQTGARRESVNQIVFDSSYFEGTRPTNKTPWTTILIVVVVIAFIVWRFLKRRKKKRARHHHSHAKID